MKKNKRYYINPRDEVSIKKALLVGRFMMVLFPLFCLISPILSAIYLSDREIIPDWGIGIAMLIGLILAWLSWSLLVTKWKIWAYSRVKNINELKRKAVEEKLIWPEGSWFNKTEIVTSYQKKQVLKLSERSLEKDVFTEDPSIPPEMILTYQMFKLIDKVMITFFLLLAIGQFVFGEKLLIVFGFLGVILLIVILQAFDKPEYKKVLLNKKGIVLDESISFSWDDVMFEKVVKQGVGSSTKQYFMFTTSFGQIKLDINQFNIKPKLLEEALKTYRIRFNNSSFT